MAPTSAIVNMYITQNATWQDAFQFGDPTDTTWSLSGMTFKCEVKASKIDATPLLTAQTSDGSIVVDDPVLRVLHFNVTDTLIKSSLPNATYVFDLVMSDASSPAIRTVLMEGYLTVRQGVTED